MSAAYIYDALFRWFKAATRALRDAGALYVQNKDGSVTDNLIGHVDNMSFTGDHMIDSH